jgi:hypothetical protein
MVLHTQLNLKPAEEWQARVCEVCVDARVTEALDEVDGVVRRMQLPKAHRHNRVDDHHLNEGVEDLFEDGVVLRIDLA